MQIRMGVLSAASEPRGSVGNTRAGRTAGQTVVVVHTQASLDHHVAVEVFVPTVLIWKTLWDLFLSRKYIQPFHGSRRFNFNISYDMYLFIYMFWVSKSDVHHKITSMNITMDQSKCCVSYSNVTYICMFSFSYINTDILPFNKNNSKCIPFRLLFLFCRDITLTYPLKGNLCQGFSFVIISKLVL